MKHSLHCAAWRVALLAVALATAPAASAAFITNSANLPPPGVYLSTDIHALYAGPALQVLLKRPEHAPLANEPIRRQTNGVDEIEDFQSTLTGTADITPQGGNTISNVAVNALGPVTTVVHGKAGQTTGTFNTEMLSMNMNGTTPLGPYMIRESPTKASVGRTTITAIGGGNFQIDSFFDVYTELSVDGGATWTPSATPVHVTLQPNHPNAIPTVSQWGLIIFTLLLLSVGTAFILRQRTPAPAAA